MTTSKLAGRALLVAAFVAFTACPFAIATLLVPAASSYAAPSPSFDNRDDSSATQVVIVAVDKLAMEDFADYSQALSEVVDRIPDGAIGMMNVRTAAAANSANGYLSLAVGGRAVAGNWAGRALMREETHMGEPADRSYQGLTGRPPNGDIVHLGIGELLRNGSLSDGAVRSESLGSILQREGRTAAVIGNSDVLGERRRYAALLAMDLDGVIPIGDVGEDTLVEDPDFPGGMRTDFTAIAERLRAYESFRPLDVIVIDVGDLARLEAMEPFLSPGRASALREATLQRIASFVTGLLDNAAQGLETGNAVGRRQVIYVISPSPSTMLGRGGTLLTPIVRWEIYFDGENSQAGPGKGVLTSATTRRDGIVANSDFLPSILDDLELAPAATGGRAWRTVAHPDALATLLSRYAEIKNVHQQRLPVIQPYFLAVLALFLVGTLFIVLARLGLLRGMSRFSPGWRFVISAYLAAPAALLLIALFPPRPLALTWALFAGLSLALALLVTGTGRKRANAPVGLIGALTAGLLIVDIILGAPLMQRSLLGYDPVAGSRYYGIGNEYMGVLIGAALTGCALILDTSRREGTLRSGDVNDGDLVPTGAVSLLPAVVFGAITFLMIHPRMGINVGGAISAACTGVVASIFVLRRPITLGSAIAWGGGVALLIVGTAFVDSLVMRDQASHLGQVVQTVGDGGTDPLWTLFGRKLAVNLRLIRLTVWSRVVFVAFAFLIVAVFLPNWFQRGLSRRFPGLFEMTKAGVIGAFVALIANDSGVVAASTLLLWPVLAVLSVLPEVARAAHDLP